MGLVVGNYPSFFPNLQISMAQGGAPGQVGRPGSRPALLGQQWHISGVPSHPKHPAQRLALDVGSPRADQVTGTCVHSSPVTRSPHPIGPACLHGPCAFKNI